MRILQVLVSSSSNYGGIALVARSVSSELARRGHEVVICSSELTGPGQKDGQVDIVIKRLDNAQHIKLSSYYLGSYGFTFSPAAIKFFATKVGEYDILHIHGYRNFFTVSSAFFAALKGVPYVIQPHGTLPRLLRKRRVKQVFDYCVGLYILRTAARVVVLTRAELEDGVAMGLEPSKLIIIPNGIDTREEELPSNRGAFRKRYGVTAQAPLILFVGRIHEIKGLDLLITAFAQLRNSEAKLVIVGFDDGYLRTLQQLISRYNLQERVILTGPLYGRAKFEAYLDGDLFVLPSRYEAFPMSVLEACVTGTPVVVTQGCRIADLVVKEGFGVVVPYDKDALGHAMMEGILSRDLHNRQELRKRAIAQFSLIRVVDQLEQLYRDVATSSS